MCVSLQMENIGNFLQACEAYGVNKQDLFQTVDLYEAGNMNSVSLILTASKGIFVSNETHDTPSGCLQNG